MDPKQQHEAYTKSWRDIIGTRWLFPKNFSEPVTLADYMEEWERLTGGSFFAYRGPVQYDQSLIEKYKENIVATIQVFAPEGNAWLETIVQFSREAHMIVTWGWSVEEAKPKLNVGLYVKDPDFYAEFLKENERYEFKEAKRPTGFGVPP